MNYTTRGCDVISVPGGALFCECATVEQATRVVRSLNNGTTGPSGRIDLAPEIRLNDDGTLDEVCAPGFHLEQMDFNHWFLEIDMNGNAVAVWLHGKGKINATYERRYHPPLATEGGNK